MKCVCAVETHVALHRFGQQRFDVVRAEIRKAQEDGVTASDEAAAVERFGHDVFVVLGSDRNIKITRPSDMDLARFYLAQNQSKAQQQE